jgi:hypothetical protein
MWARFAALRKGSSFGSAGEGEVCHEVVDSA